MYVSFIPIQAHVPKEMALDRLKQLKWFWIICSTSRQRYAYCIDANYLQAHFNMVFKKITLSLQYSDSHTREIEEIWGSLCQFWPNNLKVILRYLVIISGMAPNELLPYVSYFTSSEWCQNVLIDRSIGLQINSNGIFCRQSELHCI